MRKTGFALELSEYESQVSSCQFTIKATRAAGRKARQARHALRKALFAFALADAGAKVLPKPVQCYAKSNNRTHPYSRPEVTAWHRTQDRLADARATYQEALEDYAGRMQTRVEAMQTIEDLKAKIAEVQPFVEMEAKRKAEVKAAKDARDAKRKPKSLEDTWKAIGPDEYVPVAPMKAWVRTLKGKAEAFRENGSYILKHPGGILRLKVQTPKSCRDLRFAIRECAA